MGNFSLAKGRIRVLIITALVFLLAFGMRLVQIQAVQAATYQARANNEMFLTR
jgi:hypothetical protein